METFAQNKLTFFAWGIIFYHSQLRNCSPSIKKKTVVATNQKLLDQILEVKTQRNTWKKGCTS